MPHASQRMVTVNGVALRVTDAGPAGAPLVVLAHGFPELAFSWRHQVAALTAAGYRVLAPDQRGYGGSARPAEVSAYDVGQLSDDLVGLLDDVGAPQAVLVGHDWGAPVVYAAARRYPDRVSAVAGLSVAPAPRGTRPPTVSLQRLVGADGFFYILYFQTPGVAEADLGADPRRTLRRMYGGLAFGVDSTDGGRSDTGSPPGFVDRLPEPAGLPPWLTAAEFDHYVAEFTRTGFGGGLNWYRNLDRNWELLASVGPITQPVLFLAGSADPVLGFTRTDRLGEAVTGGYREVVIDGAGHWLQQERADSVNAALLNFLADVAPLPG